MSSKEMKKLLTMLENVSENSTPQFVKLTGYEQTDKILYANESARIEHSYIKGHEVAVFVASSAETEDPFSSNYDWRKAASAVMSGHDEDGARVIGIWYSSANVGSMCLNSEIADVRKYAALDPFCPY